MTTKEILSRVDHTILATTATWAQVQSICDDGIACSTASVCIPPSFVSRAAKYVAGNLKICTVIGFPNGYHTTAVKVFETEDAVRAGADEIDMVVNLGMVKDCDWDGILAEMKAIHTACDGRILKVIIEACQLTQDEKIKLCELVSLAGAEFIKTSTGFSTGGATLDDVRLMRQHCTPEVRIKAAGGIRDLDTARAFAAAGADRLGTSALVALAKAEG